MAANANSGILEILKEFDCEEVILAFCLSMLVGLLIGILIFIFLTWISRRRASVRISTRSDRSSDATQSHRIDDFNLSSDGTGRASLNVKRQTYLVPNEVLGRSLNFQTSTFRPLHKKTSDGTVDEKQRAVLHNTDVYSPVTDPYNLCQSESFWLGKGSLRGFLPKQTPPPAYDTVIHIFHT